MTASRRTLTSFRSRPSSTPCEMAETTPTAARDQPLSRGPQPNLKVV